MLGGSGGCPGQYKEIIEDSITDVDCQVLYSNCHTDYVSDNYHVLHDIVFSFHCSSKCDYVVSKSVKHGDI